MSTYRMGQHIRLQNGEQWEIYGDYATRKLRIRKRFAYHADENADMSLREFREYRREIFWLFKRYGTLPNSIVDFWVPQAVSL